MDQHSDPVADVMRHFGAAARAATAGTMAAKRARAEREIAQHRRQLRDMSPQLRGAAQDLQWLADRPVVIAEAVRHAPHRPGPERPARPRGSSPSEAGRSPREDRRTGRAAPQERATHPGGPDLRGDVIEVYAHVAASSQKAARNATKRSTWQMPTDAQLRYAQDLAKKQGKTFDPAQARSTMSFQDVSKAIEKMGGRTLTNRRSPGADRSGGR